MALHWYIKNKATDFKGFYIFLIAKTAEKDHFSQKSDEDGLRLTHSVSGRSSITGSARPELGTIRAL
jgi:hypothetical protein